MLRQALTPKSRSERFGRKSQREMFLDRVEQEVPWEELLALLEPHYPEAGSSQTPVELLIMLRTYFVQQWFNFSDSGTEEALYESPVLRRFVGVDLGVASAPDETAIRQFRHLLEEHNLDNELLARVNRQLDAQGILIPPGSNSDAAILKVPSSTGNGAGERDWQVPQARKNDPQRIMADARSLPDFLRGDEKQARNLAGDDLSSHPDELRSLAGDPESAETAEPEHFSYQGQAEAQNKTGSRTKSNVTGKIEPSFDALSIAVISPDHRRRYAATSALGECQSGPIREFTSYPPNLDDVPQTMGTTSTLFSSTWTVTRNMLSIWWRASVSHGLATVMVYSERPIRSYCSAVCVRALASFSLCPSTRRHGRGSGSSLGPPFGSSPPEKGGRQAARISQRQRRLGSHHPGLQFCCFAGSGVQ
jgi:IS5 family transposase